MMQGSVAADVIGSAVDMDEPLMAAGMDRFMGLHLPIEAW